MASYLHPSGLNPVQQYRQAGSIFRRTSRANNPAWYQEALELDLQLHLRIDGTSLSAFFHDRKNNQWAPGPTLTEEHLKDPAKSEGYAAEALRLATATGSTALGVILHIADEFAIAELKPELDNPAALPELREASFTDPASILDDSSVPADQAAWRVLPYPAAGSETIATTITVSRQYAAFLEAFRLAGEKANFPIATQALSAPLVAIMGLPHRIEPTRGRPFVTILQYPWFTVLAFFNEHADLRLVRTLQHRGIRRPTNFRHALGATNASLEFIDPDLFLLPLGAAVDTTLVADLRMTFPASRVENIAPQEVEQIPFWAPEPLIATLPKDQPSALNSHTFTILRNDQWALQNFLPAPKEDIEVFPTRQEMKMLKIFKLSRVALFAVAVLSLIWAGFGIIHTITQLEWKFNAADATTLQARMAKLNKDRTELNHWNNLLADRSKAWITMEDLARLFPENSGVSVKGYSYGAKPETTAGQQTTGFSKEWKIVGLANEEALEYLNTLNTREGIADHFARIARATGNEAYQP